jgi:hypothetical protein
MLNPPPTPPIALFALFICKRFCSYHVLPIRLALYQAR